MTVKLLFYLIKYQKNMSSQRSLAYSPHQESLERQNQELILKIKQLQNQINKSGTKELKATIKAFGQKEAK